jgi:O-antigen ligase
MAVLKFITVFLIFILLPFGQIGKIDINNFSFTYFDAGVAMLVLCWFIYSLVIKRRIEGFLKKPILFFISTGVLSLAINSVNLSSEQLLIAFSYLFRFVLFALIYFVFKNFDKSFNKKVVKYFFFSGILILILGFLQFLFYPNLRNLYYLGWDEHLYRLFSTFLDPNFAGIFLVIVFFTGVFLFKEQNKILYLFFSSLTFIGIFLTYSRTAIVFLVLSAIVFLTITKQKKLFIGFIFFIILAIFFVPKSFKTEGTNLLRIASVNERITSMSRGLSIFTGHPLFGVGFNAYKYAQERYGFINNENISAIPNRAGAGVENSYILVLATEGLAGFIAYLYLLINIFKLYTRRANLYSHAMLAILLGLFVSAFFINSLFYTFFMFWMFMTAGIIEST